MTAAIRNHGATRRLHLEATRGRSLCGQEAKSRNTVLLTLLPERVTCAPCRALINGPGHP